MTICSLFSGIGGIDLGFIQAGFKIVWANENNEDAVRTYKYNFGEEHLVEKDIRLVNAADIPDFDVLVAGFPCQPFSVLGKQKGFDDPRGQLFFEITRIIQAKHPQVVFLENVANLLEHDAGKTFLAVYNALVPYGYTLKYSVIDAIDYGNVPQHRTRIFIVAFLDPEMCDRFTFPEPIKRTATLNDVLFRSQKHNPMYYLSKDDIRNDLVRKFAADKYALCQYRESSRSYSMHRVCPTLVASMGDFPELIPIIQDDFGIRRVTPYECLSLLGFPADFRFPNIPIASAYRQCGNSVAVPVVRRIAEQIKKVMDLNMVEVVAALIWDKDKFMICQRPADKARALLWEFVGGKVETGETKEQALIRECQEELAITLAVGDVFMEVVHEYPDITVYLTLFSATIADGIPQKLEHNDIRWITPAEIPNYEFCPADEEILKRIIEVYNG